MPVATFDTLKFATTLKEAGVPDKQAEAQARAFGEAFQVNLKDLSTKDDIKQAVAESELRLGNKIDAAVAGLNNRDDSNVASLTNRIDAAVAGLINKIEQVAAEGRNARTEIKGDINLLRWICGVNTALLVTALIRLFLYLPR